MSKYRVIRTESGNAYQCINCEAVFKGFSAKQDILTHIKQEKCLDSFSDTSHNRQEHIARHNYGKTKKSGNGYIKPDKSGRWRLGRNAEEKRLIAYYKALFNLNSRDKKYSIESFMENYEPSGVYPKWANKRSPLQKLAYAFNNRNWEMVKYCAYQLVYDVEVRKRINAYFQHIKDISRNIDGFLAELEKQAFAQGEMTQLIIEPEDLNLN